MYIRHTFRLKQTSVSILAREREHIAVAISAIVHHRGELEGYIQRHPFFAITLEPCDVERDAPEVVHRMAEAGWHMGVGPMAAVAGTIASLAAEAMRDEGATLAVVDNGGDIALIADEPLCIGIYAGTSAVEGFAFELQPTSRVLGICTSSGTLGHSISFGMADAATVLAHDVSIADAAATRLGNEVVGELSDEVFDPLRGKRISGAMVIKGDRVAMFGSLPRIVRATVDPELITRG
ncbi:UPF0280 family protein [Methermicoccus shengliensis]|uniref:UPF0280 protein HA299_00320 n=1 Tax=Methermicoccus shengliensis TaxID=660064 RepID=A0A832VM50_9EURY|nr:UPF0280 family protein [Methermicoccus shengliensis]KUK04080.1 MAG: hypothetical protein XD46_1204 [Euryarchaeota archaeon 55_53]KUK29810.1 MAG: hypothetical protein XD62_1124 [Methanosarcinales archeaon 56_1174]MDI3488398.1 uncharacterized protein [Methanosarcinales archaeon]MDN5295038.1 uncharacterized protein [Methanosarcinales archaeon]HIH69061.1 UPF0280 family protein [Methermicoccus shengliensis]